MSRVQIESWAWDLIVEHYAGIRDPGPDDRRVMQYILDKEARRADREDFLEARARYARLRDWSSPSD